MGKIRGKWTEESMKAVVQSVLKGEKSIRESSQRYCVPKSSLSDRLKNLKRGQEAVLKPNTDNKGTFQRTFNEEQERMLYEHCKKLDAQLMPLNRTEFMKLAYQFAEVLKVKHRFNKSTKMARKAFYYDFMTKYEDLSLRTAQSTSLQRAVGFNKEQVSRFFDKLTELMTKYTFPPSRIFNADETGVSVVHTSSLKVISSKGKKQVGKLTTAERGRNVTILLCINATGDQFIPPLFVLPRQRIDVELKKDAPLGSIFDGQPNGWITKDGFLKWLTLFQERVKSDEKSPVLLIVDGHGSHKDLDVIVFAKEHHIHMISLPPHTSHKMQPLDRAIMKPFKNAYNEACSLWMRRYPLMKIALKDIAGLVNEAFLKICRMELAKSGFACTGISPLNPNIFTDLDFQASLFSQMDTDSQPENASGPETSKSLCQPEQSSFLDLTVPGTSAKSPNVLEAISPLPSSSNSKFKIRKGRAEKSEILTSTPYKSQLKHAEH
ncbi:MFS-type transporter clz9-like [Homalodisca vitripennis]|uniref:MFS-type transporter clz9-like n=1 Tax=Homalodisca vitripennis TaxID=197043 RepID=UPI001EEACE40|nr:MFS-type transporter clz9-like [Homalodisca vitripennis]